MFSRPTGQWHQVLQYLVSLCGSNDTSTEIWPHGRADKETMPHLYLLRKRTLPVGQIYEQNQEVRLSFRTDHSALNGSECNDVSLSYRSDHSQRIHAMVWYKRVFTNMNLGDNKRCLLDVS